MLVHLYSIVINFLMFSNKYGLANMDTRIPQLRIQVLDAGPGRRILDAGLLMLDSGLWTLASEHWTLDTGLWMLDPGRWTLDIGLWLLVYGCWAMNAGLWALDAGHYTLDAGLWTLDTVVDCFRTESEPSFWFCLIKLLKILSCESLRTS